MNKKEEKVVKTLRKLIVECVKIAPNLREIEKITGEKYPDIKKNPFWQTVSYDVDKNASDHLKATHLAVLATEKMLEEIFGNTVVFYEQMVEIPRTPTQREIFGLCSAVRKLHEVQQAIELQKVEIVN